MASRLELSVRWIRSQRGEDRQGVNRGDQKRKTREREKTESKEDAWPKWQGYMGKEAVGGQGRGWEEP